MAALLPRLTLVLGGARSGKSRYAEELVRKHPPPWIYIATAEALDDEMRIRIADHAARRGEGWATVEAPLALGDAIAAHGASGRPVLVDCLTLWLSNVFLAGMPIPDECGRLCSALSKAPGPVVVVSNEVGLGIVPENKLGRDFRDAQGRLNAEVAALAGHVVFMAAGLPLIMKQP
jgi:adenosylcobinamide kinase/adenosylcobinamide-phosphate guanylyltransferase